MEFNEKLQELRRQKGMTQEELAGKLYVSRTAISKWESGRGYPNIESLKAIARLFSVTVDDLLSSAEILTVAQEDGKHRERATRSYVFGLLDLSAALLFFLPVFAQRRGEIVESVSLFNLTQAPTYLKIMFFTAVFGTVALGILSLVLQVFKSEWCSNGRIAISLALSLASVLLFILSLKPYAAIFAFTLLAIKTLMLIKR